MDRIRIIKRSLRCCAFGWLGLVPILGVPTAVLALLLYKKVQEELQSLKYARFEFEGQTILYRDIENEVEQPWNPARKYLVLGCTLAWCGLILSILALGGCLWLVLRALAQ